MDDDITVECDICGRAFFGPGVRLVVRRYFGDVVCSDCLRKLTRIQEGSPRVASPAKRERVARRVQAKVGGV